MGLIWCSVCGGNHAKAEACPGELRATGPERHGWRVAVETPNGVEAYGVLVAPSLDSWRARIITYPNVLWTVPGGGVTLKFTGATPQEAETRAVAFVEGHIGSRGYARLDALDTPAVSRYRAEAQSRTPGAANPAPRKMRAIPVRFGIEPPLVSAMTGDVSESGIFVATLVPFDPGAHLRVVLELGSKPLGLRGKVVWKRPRPVTGRPAGMGVQLVSPPTSFRAFIASLP